LAALLVRELLGRLGAGAVDVEIAGSITVIEIDLLDVESAMLDFACGFGIGDDALGFCVRGIRGTGIGTASEADQSTSAEFRS
jgi:hypothetical protein